MSGYLTRIRRTEEKISRKGIKTYVKVSNSIQTHNCRIFQHEIFCPQARFVVAVFNLHRLCVNTGVLKVGSLWVAGHWAGARRLCQESPDARVRLSKDRHFSADGVEWKITHPASQEGGKM